MTALLVGIAGMIGALLRFGMDTLCSHGSRFAAGKPRYFPLITLPLATLLVNAVGSFLIGLAGGLSTHTQLPPEWHTAIATGLAGGLTTFSSFTVATILLWKQRRRAAAALNVVMNLLLGMALAWLGFALAG